MGGGGENEGEKGLGGKLQLKMFPPPIVPQNIMYAENVMRDGWNHPTNQPVIQTIEMEMDFTQGRVWWEKFYKWSG